MTAYPTWPQPATPPPPMPTRPPLWKRLAQPKIITALVLLALLAGVAVWMVATEVGDGVWCHQQQGTLVQERAGRVTVSTCVAQGRIVRVFAPERKTDDDRTGGLVERCHERGGVAYEHTESPRRGARRYGYLCVLNGAIVERR